MGTHLPPQLVLHVAGLRLLALVLGIILLTGCQPGSDAAPTPGAPSPNASTSSTTTTTSAPATATPTLPPSATPSPRHPLATLTPRPTASATFTPTALSIAQARRQVGQTVHLEGWVSAAWLADGDGFYLQDHTGGIRVRLPPAFALPAPQIGDRLGLTGLVNRAGSLIQVEDLQDIAVITAADNSPPLPTSLTANPLAAADWQSAYLGQLVQLEGQALAVFEDSSATGCTGSRLDLAIQNQAISLYIDPRAGIDLDAIRLGQAYRAVGILETSAEANCLLLRQPEDLTPVDPPGVYLSVSAPVSIPAPVLAHGAQGRFDPGRFDPITYTLTLYNHTLVDHLAITVTAVRPTGGSIAQVLDGGTRDGTRAIWNLPSLAAGEQARLRFSVDLAPGITQPVVLSKVSALGLGWPVPLQAAQTTTFIGSRVPIWAIQGRGAQSPYLGASLATDGVVTGVFPELNGFFIQSPGQPPDLAQPDFAPAHGYGLFISGGSQTAGVAASFPFAPGDQVVVTGTVQELAGQTALVFSDPAQMRITSRRGALPLAVELDPPVSPDQSADTFEALEGALVMVSGPAQVLAPTDAQGSYAIRQSWQGDSWSSGDSWSPGDRLFPGQDWGALIWVDDGQRLRHADRSTQVSAVAVGDEVTGLIGPLIEIHGRYLIEPIVTPQVTARFAPIPTVSPASPDQAAIMTWALAAAALPLDPLDSACATRLANTLLAAGAPHLIGFQNLPASALLEHLAQHELLAGYGYQAIVPSLSTNSQPGVGYLVRVQGRSDQGRSDPGDQQPSFIGKTYTALAASGLFQTPPLLLQFDLVVGAHPITVYGLNASFAPGADAFYPSLYAFPSQAQLQAQVEAVARLAADLQAQEPDAVVIVLGSLESDLASPLIAPLFTAGLQPVLQFGQGRCDPGCSNPIPYTTVDQGMARLSEALFVSPTLFQRLRRVDILHLNADFPLPVPGDPAPFGVSRHDPVVALFDLAP